MPIHTHNHLRPEAEFSDSGEWRKLAERHLGRYRLPGWDVPCTEQEMAVWLDRLNISKSEYMDFLNTSFQDWVKMNPDWPLRAWIGMVSEFVTYNAAFTEVYPRTAPG